MALSSSYPYRCIILDACCAITLYESGHMRDILATTRRQVVIAAYVHQGEIRRADLRPLIASGHLTVVSTESEEEDITWVNYARELEDGEAVTGAIATHRGWAIATDEAKAIRFFSQVAPQLQLVTTPELVKHWEECLRPPSEVARAALENIQTNGRYRPGPRHPLYGWWQSHFF